MAVLNSHQAEKKAKENINNIMGMNLITHQTGEQGQLVRKVMVAEAIDIAKEYYVAITLDRSSGKNVFAVSTEGGMDIEEVAAKTPEKIARVWVSEGAQLQGFQARKLAYALGLSGDLLNKGVNCFQTYIVAIVKQMPQSLRSTLLLKQNKVTY